MILHNFPKQGSVDVDAFMTSDLEYRIHGWKQTRGKPDRSNVSWPFYPFCLLLHNFYFGIEVISAPNDNFETKCHYFYRSQLLVPKWIRVELNLIFENVCPSLFTRKCPYFEIQERPVTFVITVYFVLFKLVTKYRIYH